MIKASIDIGSNSTLLCIAETSGEFKVLEDHSEVTGLGRGINKTSMLCAEAMVETSEALAKYVGICKIYNIPPEEVIITATEASRVAKNAKKFFELVKKKLNLHVKIIAADGEAYYTALGVNISEKSERNFICDIGGASTEIINFNSKLKKVNKFLSLPLGSVRAKDWLDSGIFVSQVEKVLVDIENEFNPKPKSVIWVAGTIIAITCLILELNDFDPRLVHNANFSIEDLKKLKAKLKGLTEDQILKTYPILGKRARTIYTGILLVEMIAKTLELSTIKVSNYGLRHGTLKAGEIDDKFIR